MVMAAWGGPQARLQQPTMPSSLCVSRAWPRSAEGLWVLNNGVTRREDAQDHPPPAQSRLHNSLGGMCWLAAGLAG